MMGPPAEEGATPSGGGPAPPSGPAQRPVELEVGAGDSVACGDRPGDEMDRFLRLLFAPGDVFEIRVLGYTRTGQRFTGNLSGYYQHEQIARAAADLVALERAGRAAGMYATLNPVAPDLLGRAINRLVQSPKAMTGDSQIVRRVHLLIDCDPVRHAGVSSTERELGLAKDRARRLRDFLRERGWPDPIAVMSGNGVHLIYRIDLPADDGGLVERVLAALAQRFDDEAVKIDRAVSNPSRITKIAGTMVRKGDHLVGVEGLDDRPHRRARLLRVPERIEVVARALLESLAAGKAPAAPAPPPRAAPAADGPFDRFDHTPEGVRGYLERRGVRVVKQRCSGSATYLCLDRCPVVPECVATNVTDIAVVVADSGLVAYKNLHNRGVGLRWQDVREALEPGYKAHAAARAGQVLVAARGSQEETHAAVPAPWEPPAPLLDGRVPPPFPLAEAFTPGLAPIREFIAGLAEELQVPVDLPAMLLLPIASVCIAQKFVIEARSGWRENAAVWSLVLMESGERKSPAFRRMTDPLLEWEQHEAERLAPDIATANEERELMERERLAARKRGGEGDAEARERAIELARVLAAREEIHPPTLVSSDATSEALVELMVRNGERALVASPEADALDVMMGRYDDRARPNMGVWLKGYSGDRVRVHRRGRPPEFLERPTLSVALAVQPEAVQGLFASRAARGRGLLARFFPSVPAGMVGRRRIGAAPVDERWQMAYVTTLRRLLDLPLEPEMGPRTVRLDEAAARLMTEFEARVEQELARGGTLGDQRAWGSKLCGGILRIALVLHCLEHVVRDAAGPIRTLHVSPETIRAALGWAPYLVEHERIATALAGADPRLIGADRILRWLERTGLAEFSRRDCFTSCRGPFIRTTEDLDGPVRLLEELGYIRRRAAPAGVQRVGRPPSDRFEVNPLWRRPSP